MRAVAGLILLHALLLATGGAFLYACRLVDRRVGSLAAAVGLAHLAGVGLVSLATIFLLIAGVGVGAPTIVALAVVLSAGLVAAGELDRRRRAPAAGERCRIVAAWPMVVMLGGFVVWAAVRSLGITTAWDAAHNWTLKSVVLLDSGHLTPAVFDSPRLFATSHLDYPLLLPMFESLALRFAGRADQGLLVIELWILMLAFVGSVIFLIGPHVGSVVLAPIGLLITASTSSGILRGEADVPLAIFMATGLLAFARWIDADDRRFLPVAVLLVGAGANTKNEGFAYCLALVPVAILFAAAAGRRAWVPVGLTIVCLAALILPWRLWVAAHGPFAIDYTSPTKALSWRFLASRWHDLDIGARGVLTQLSDLSSAGWLVAVFCAFCILVLVRGPQRRLSGFYLTAALAMTATILWAYWTSPQADLAGHVERTAFRLISAPLFLAGVGLAHLLNGELRAGEELSAAEPRETARPCLSKEASVVAPSGGRSESIR